MRITPTQTLHTVLHALPLPEFPKDAPLFYSPIRSFSSIATRQTKMG